jgi:sporulation protein YlmC with PRC-barrel domain
MAVRSMSAGTLMGDTVKNRTEENIGSLEEIMIDLESGQVSYVVLSAGGFLGLGEKFFAIPWEMVSVDTDDKKVVIDLDKETLENAPGFDKDNWPDASDLNWLNEVYVYHEVEPYWSNRA